MKRIFIGKVGKNWFGALPQIGDYSSRMEWEAACWEKISKSEKLLRLLVTSHERRDLVMRAACLHGLVSGKSYRQIGEELWLSPQTVSGIKRAIHEKNYRSYLERSKKERRKRQYSFSSARVKSKPSGWPRRTKYGKIYLPH